MSDSEENWRDAVELVENEFRIGEFEFHITQMEELPATVSLFMLAEMHEKESEISGKRVWAGSHVLCRYLVQHPELINQKRVLELGAGTGLCSMICDRLGAERVLATDGDHEVVDILETNLKRNECGNTESQSLWWGHTESMAALRAKSGADGDCFDVVLAGDVLYKRELLPLLFSTIKLCMDRNANCEFILCHIPRADVSQKVVQQFATEQFELQMEILESPSMLSEYPDECPLEDIQRAQLYRFKRREKTIEY